MDIERLESVKKEVKKELKETQLKLKSINKLQEDTARQVNTLRSLLHCIDDILELQGD
ncbi:MAG: hypothetical protein IJ258_05175 [Methanobrevibacter sp.]|uniref:hypothetical protein n=1 Tax=Methanobrevibacter sp. TaxID=66852 RepID=UPI0025EF8576|nr:hypothetical protein [Methanobrevibacter sp.]MBQ8017481.1 hypothetical protein [Methanobrevibacter sp.]